MADKLTLTHAQWCSVLGAVNEERSVELSAFGAVLLPELKRIVKEVSDLGNLTVAEVVESLKSPTAWKFFSALKFNFKLIGKAISSLADLYKAGIMDLCTAVYETKAWKNVELLARMCDDWLAKHPNLKRIVGFGILGFYLIGFINGNYTGHPEMDMDFTTAIAAAYSGNYSLSDFFTSPQGILFVTLWVSSAAFSVSIPWFSIHPILSVFEALCFTTAKHLRKKIPMKKLTSSVESDSTMQASELGFEKTLPFIAKELNISTNLDDYLVFTVPLLWSDLPNRNGVGFPLSELLRWVPGAGCQAYKTWVGKPMFIEHESDDHKTAIGVILDTSLTQVKGFGDDKVWKVMGLCAIDKKKAGEYGADMDSGKLNSFSMGAYVGAYTCSYCGSKIGRCDHIDPEDKSYIGILNGRLVYRLVHDIEGYEYSSVRNPAYVVAVSDMVIRYGTK